MEKIPLNGCGQIFHSAWFFHLGAPVYNSGATNNTY